ncbi:MAG: hypothetical protein ACO3K8_07690, partial [Pseudohongiellaceae bacterium]
MPNAAADCLALSESLLNAQVKENLVVYATHRHDAATDDASSLLNNVHDFTLADAGALASATGTFMRNGTVVSVWNGS